MRRVIAVRFDGELGSGASSITPGKVYPLVSPKYEHDSRGDAMLGQFMMTVPFNRPSAHLGGGMWTLIYEDIGTIVISNNNLITLFGSTYGKQYSIEKIEGNKVIFKDDNENDSWIEFGSLITFYVIINNQVINSNKYEYTRINRA